MESNFTGGLLGLIGINILCFLLTLFTLGLATPWAICISIEWYTKHTTLDGRKVKFVGTGGSLFGQFIKWWFLTIITLGIYGFWVGLKMTKWVVQNCHLE